MKKAKIMLSAIAVFALVGGALAFKAHKSQVVDYFTCNTLATPKTCAAVEVQGTNLALVKPAINTVTVTSATISGVDGASCTSTHPCTATIFYQSTTNQ